MREIRDVQMVVVGVRIQDTDDAELCGICRACAVVLTAFEADNDIDIDGLAAQVSDNSVGRKVSKVGA